MRCQTCGRAAPPLGALVVDELIIPVVDVYLGSGAFITTAHLYGPIRAGDSTDYVLMDRAGRTVYRSAGRNRLFWPALPEGAQLMVTTEMQVDVVA